MAYKDYQHLLGKPYIEGYQDCFGLVRNYYHDLYEIDIRNWARPVDAFYNGMDLLSVSNWREEGFELTEDSVERLQIGDVLLIAIGCKIANHTAVFVGNHHIIHHLADKKSAEDSFSGAWKKRVMNVVRHPFVTEENKKIINSVDLLELLPPHVKVRHKLINSVG